MLLVGVLAALAALSWAAADAVRWSRWGLPRWPRQAARLRCSFCRASFLVSREDWPHCARAALALDMHVRAGHQEELAQQLWPHRLPARCADIVARRRPLAAAGQLRVVGGRVVPK